MATKRSRVVRSSSLGEVALLDAVQRMESPVAIWEKKRATAAKVTSSKSVPIQKPQKAVSKSSNVSVSHPVRSILTLGSPVREFGPRSQVDERFGVFFQACSLCKKELKSDADVYMYGYLGSFCSPECRDAKIAIDDSFRPPSPKPQPARANSSLVGKPQTSSARSGAGFGFAAKREVARFK